MRWSDVEVAVADGVLVVVVGSVSVPSFRGRREGAIGGQ